MATPSYGYSYSGSRGGAGGSGPRTLGQLASLGNEDPNRPGIMSRFVGDLRLAARNLFPALGNIAGAILSDTVASPLRSLVPGGKTGYERSQTFDQVLKPLGQSLGNTAMLAADVVNPMKLVPGSAGDIARLRAGNRMREFSDNPGLFLIEHLGNVALTGSIAARPLAAGARAAAPASVAARAPAGTAAGGRLIRPTKSTLNEALDPAVRQARLDRGIRPVQRGDVRQARTAQLEQIKQAGEGGSGLARSSLLARDTVGRPYTAALRRGADVKLPGKHSLREVATQVRESAPVRLTGPDGAVTHARVEPTAPLAATIRSFADTPKGQQLASHIGAPTRKAKELTEGVRRSRQDLRTTQRTLGYEGRTQLLGSRIAQARRTRGDDAADAWKQELSSPALDPLIGRTRRLGKRWEDITPDQAGEAAVALGRTNPDNLPEAIARIRDDSVIDLWEKAQGLEPGAIKDRLTLDTIGPEAAQTLRRGAEALRTRGVDPETVPKRFLSPERVETDVSTAPIEVQEALGRVRERETGVTGESRLAREEAIAGLGGLHERMGPALVRDPEAPTGWRRPVEGESPAPGAPHPTARGEARIEALDLKAEQAKRDVGKAEAKAFASSPRRGLSRAFETAAVQFERTARQAVSKARAPRFGEAGRVADVDWPAGASHMAADIIEGSLYRGTSASDLWDALGGGSGRWWVTNDPALALGQGRFSDLVRVEMRPPPRAVLEQPAKPTKGFAASQGSREFIMEPKNPDALPGSIRRVEVDMRELPLKTAAGAAEDFARERVISRLRQLGFEESGGPGRAVFSRPDGGRPAVLAQVKDARVRLEEIARTSGKRMPDSLVNRLDAVETALEQGKRPQIVSEVRKVEAVRRRYQEGLARLDEKAAVDAAALKRAARSAETAEQHVWEGLAEALSDPEALPPAMRARVAAVQAADYMAGLLDDLGESALVDHLGLREMDVTVQAMNTSGMEPGFLSTVAELGERQHGPSGHRASSTFRDGRAPDERLSASLRDPDFEFEHGFDRTVFENNLQIGEEVITKEFFNESTRRFTKRPTALAREMEARIDLDAWEKLAPAERGRILSQEGFVRWEPNGPVPILKNAPATPDSLWIHSSLADVLTTHHSSGNLFSFLTDAVAEPAMRGWKGLTLGLRPAWQVGNAVGNAMMSMIQGQIDPITYFRTMARPAMEAMRRYNLGEDPFPGMTQARAAEALQTRGITQMTGESAGVRDVRAGTGALDPSAPATPGIGQALSGLLDKGGRPVAFSKRNLRRGITGGFRANNFMDNLNRMTVMIANVDRLGMEGAMRLAVEALGDYSKMSKFERTVVKQGFPFWAWQRHIMQLTARQLSPAHLTRTTMGLHLAQLAAEQDEWRDMLPEYQQGAMGVGEDGPQGPAHMLFTKNLNPFQDALEPFMLRDEIAPLRGFTRAMGPLTSFLTERATGTSTFTGRPFTSATPKVDEWGRVVPEAPPLGEHLFQSFGTPLGQMVRDLGRTALGRTTARYDSGEPVLWEDAYSPPVWQRPLSNLTGLNLRPSNLGPLAESSAKVDQAQLTRLTRRQQEEEAYQASQRRLGRLLPGN